MDKLVSDLIAKEYQRQQDELELIASENYVSPEVMQAYANVFTNKYAEGYPGKRYYGGQIRVDRVETLAQWRALRMFGLLPSVSQEDEHAILEREWYEQIREDMQKGERAVNVQPLSGGPANAAVFLSCLQHGDTVLGMSLDCGGHLSHGHPLNMSGLNYTIVPYGVDQTTHMIDYDDMLQKALESKPQLILWGFSAYSRQVDRKKIAEIADEVEKKHGYRPLLMADIAHVAGLIAGGVYDGPFDCFDIITTTTHKTLRGPRGGLIYMKRGILQRNDKDVDLERLINRGVFPGLQWWPHEHIIAAKAVAFGEVLYGSARWGTRQSYAQRVVDNARVMADELMKKWRSVETGWTDNHIVLLDVTKKWDVPTELTGKKAEELLEDIWVSVNKNMLPFDARSPMDPSGIRLGTPALTTRGLGVEEVKELVDIMDRALSAGHATSELKEEVHALCQRFPLKY